MAETITSDNFEQYWLQSQEAHGQALEGTDRVEVVTDPSSAANTISLPAVLYDRDPSSSSAIALRYVQIPFSALSVFISAGSITYEKLAPAVQETIEGKLDEVTQQQFNAIFD